MFGSYVLFAALTSLQLFSSSLNSEIMCFGRCLRIGCGMAPISFTSGATSSSYLKRMSSRDSLVALGGAALGAGLVMAFGRNTSASNDVSGK